MKNFNLLNTAIYELFFTSHKKGTNVVLSIDKQLFDSFYCEYQIDPDQLILEVSQLFKLDWSIALKANKDGIPNFLGLIGIQIYAAHLMKKEEQYSAAAYNPQLCRLLNISLSQLQSLYSKFQEKIWRKFESWAELEGFSITLPDRKKGRGCHIQYPLSQCLLNQEDLSKLPLLFEKAGLKPCELLSFDDFQSIISNADHGNFLTNRYYRLKTQLLHGNKIQILEKQIFTYYLSWDGKLPDIEDREFRTKISKDRIFSENLVLRTENIDLCLFEILIFDENENAKYKIKSSDKALFEKLNRKKRLVHIDAGIILFVKNDIYDNEWDESRFLERNRLCLILDEKKRTYIQDFLYELDKKFTKHSGKYYNLYQVNIPEDKAIPPYYNFLFSQSKRPFSVQNGLKLSRKVWMFGAGPDFIFEKPIRVWLNGREINLMDLQFSCRDLKPGKYILNIKDYAPFEFLIENPDESSTSGDKCGWQVNLKDTIYKPDKHNFQISGLKLSFSIDSLSEHRKWINALLRKPQKENHISTLVTKAIMRSY